MAASKRVALARRRKARGFSQESLAEALGVDRTTVARWEQGLCEPQPYQRSRLCELLQVTLDELDELLTCVPPPERTSRGCRPDDPLPDFGYAPIISTASSDEIEDMNRRELLGLLSVAGTLVTVPNLVDDAFADETDEVAQYEFMNSHLWQVFALSESKRAVYPIVRQQLDMVTADLRRAHSPAVHRRLCALTGDLLQLAGEIFFDADRYTDAAHCYRLAADASKEGGAVDQWACALTRHAYLDMYERRFPDATLVLDGAARIARRGDSRLSTRHWVAAVQAEAYAGLGELDECRRALDRAEQVRALPSPVMPGGWLRFDGSRLAEKRGTCYAALGRADLAAAALTEALDTAPSLRRRGSILTDLAALGVQAHDLDQVLDCGDQATDLAEQTRSSGYIGRKLQRLRVELGPLMSDRRVARLSDRIAQL